MSNAIQVGCCVHANVVPIKPLVIGQRRRRRSCLSGIVLLYAPDERWKVFWDSFGPVSLVSRRIIQFRSAALSLKGINMKQLLETKDVRDQGGLDKATQKSMTSAPTDTAITTGLNLNYVASLTRVMPGAAAIITIPKAVATGVIPGVMVTQNTNTRTIPKPNVVATEVMPVVITTNIS